jgi:hypothetical protein
MLTQMNGYLVVSIHIQATLSSYKQPQQTDDSSKYINSIKKLKHAYI